MAGTEQDDTPEIALSNRLDEPSIGPAWLAVVAGALLGLLTFFAVGATHTLSPSRVGWLFDTADPSTHYLGWCFFRQDAWRWPLGINPKYGMEMGSSIVYSDSIPLMAMVFKPFSQWMGDDFQYTGIWLLLCLLLQGVWAMLLMRQLNKHLLLQVLGAAFLVIPVVLLKRLEGHYALAGQWIVLWAICHHVKGRGRSGPLTAGRTWAIIAALAALIHLYLAAMVIAIWQADVLREWMAGRRRPRALLGEYAIVLGTMLVAMWMVGYFAIGFGDSRTPGTAGAYSMNLLGPLDSRGFSRFLPALPLDRPGQEEGTCYLGLGMILLAGIVVCHRAIPRQSSQISGQLLIVCAVITLFALSPILTLGRWRILESPNYWGFVGEIFRASGRVIWPAYYVFFLVVIAATIRRFPTRTAGWLLAAMLVVQVADLSPLFVKLQEHFAASPTIASPLKDPFWEKAGQKYKCILIMRPDGTDVDWLGLGRIAAQHRMAISYGYFARSNWNLRQAADQERLNALRRGSVDPDALYVVCDEKVMDQIRATLPADAWAGEVDGIRVIAPGFQSISN